MLRMVLASLLFAVLIAALTFGVAGRLDLPFDWAYLGLLLLPGLVLMPLLHHRHPGLIEERLRPGPGERDPRSIAAMWLCMPAAWLVAGLDVGRFHWSRGFPPGLQIAGLVCVAVGLWAAGWAMWVNPFFSSAVRLQPDRGQRVITTGPYALVRHPGYTGAVLFTIGSGPALGSWWAAILFAPILGVLVRRTWLEDRMLRDELDAYADYARAVRFRLIPGVW